MLLAPDLWKLLFVGMWVRLCEEKAQGATSSSVQGAGYQHQGLKRPHKTKDPDMVYSMVYTGKHGL